jgi:hypothetical protein
LKPEAVARLQHNPSLFNGPLPLSSSDIICLQPQIDSMLDPHGALTMIQSNVFSQNTPHPDIIAMAQSTAFIDTGTTHRDEPSIADLLPDDIDLLSGHYKDINPSQWWRRQVERQQSVTTEVERMCGAVSIEYATALAELVRLYSGLAMSIDEEGPASMAMATDTKVDTKLHDMKTDDTKSSEPKSITDSQVEVYGLLQISGMSNPNLKSSAISRAAAMEQRRTLLDTDVDEKQRLNWINQMKDVCEITVKLANRAIICARAQTSELVPIEVLAKAYMALGEVIIINLQIRQITNTIILTRDVNSYQSH